MFEMRSMVKHFGSVKALDGACLTVKPGEIRALLGSNGSGKSTIVKIMGGIVRANAGELLMDGAPIRIDSSADSRSFGFAVAYQELSLLPKMSVIDNIMLGHEYTRRGGVLDEKRRRESAAKLLERLEIKCSLDALVQNISPSEQSMVEVAKALSRDPKFLLLDEVTASLHHDEVEALFRVLREEKAKGVSILIVTHRMNEIYQVCDSATIFRNGVTVAEGPMSQFPLNEVIYHMTGTRVKEEAAAAPRSLAKEKDMLLRVEHLVMRPKVSDISLHVGKGEIVGIGGLEGQGQAEYMKAIFGDLTPEAGEMWFEGRRLRLKDTAQAVRHGISYISGDRTKESVFSLRTIEENLTAGDAALGRVWSWVSAGKIRKMASDAVEQYQIKIGSITDSASSLSGGNQQKLAIARGIAVGPKLLLLNDPTKGVDINSRNEIHKILRDSSARGMGILLVSSDTEELLGICSRIYVFYEGKVVAELTGDQRTEENVVRAMIGGTPEGKEGAGI